MTWCGQIILRSIWIDVTGTEFQGHVVKTQGQSGVQNPRKLYGSSVVQYVIGVGDKVFQINIKFKKCLYS